MVVDHVCFWREDSQAYIVNRKRADGAAHVNEVRPRTLEPDDMEEARAWTTRWAEGNDDEVEDIAEQGIDIVNAVVIKMEKEQEDDKLRRLDSARPAGA